jgi:flagellar motor switch protein FliM
MANVLSQDEVDSLLGGIGEGKVKTEPEAPEKGEGLQGYDFNRQTGPVHLRMPTLGIINERFIGFLKSSLSATTRSVIDINILDFESVKFGEFTRSIPLPTSLNIFKMEPLRGFALLILEGSLVFSFVDTFFGGKAVSSIRLEGKSFTTIEVKIVDKIVKIILNDFQNAWSDVYNLKMVFARSEVDPQFAGIASPTEMVIQTRFNVELENSSGVMTICMPYSTLEPIREKLRFKFQGERLEIDETWREFLAEKIKKMTVGLNCTLGTTRVSGRELLEIKVDDVIQLDQKISDPINIGVEGVPKFKGYPGTCGKKKAIRINQRISKEYSDE